MVSVPASRRAAAIASFRLPIGNEAVDIVQMREYRQRALVELGMVGDDDGFRGPPHHRAINGSGLVIGVVDAAALIPSH